MSPQPKILEEYYLSKPEPYQSCLLALRDLILHANPGICHVRKYQVPFFTYNDKKLGYLWLNGKKLMLGFCVDRQLQLEMDPNVKRINMSRYRSTPTPICLLNLSCKS